MHYKKLLKAHEIFKEIETRGWKYHDYIKNKGWQKWRTNSVTISEVEKLFDFIRYWDFHFRGDPDKFLQIYQQIYPIVQQLEGGRLEDVDFSDEGLKRNTEEIFDKVARCPKEVRYESTDASKIIHTILPNLFVMWDESIQWGILRGVTLGGYSYAYEFLPRMQKEVHEAINACMAEEGLDREGAIRKISESCDNNTLPKLIDEFNYVKYTLKKQI